MHHCTRFTARCVFPMQLGNPLWVNHVNRYHELIMISLIKYMALYNIPLVEEDACEMFRKLAVATAKDEGRDLTKSSRWNGKRNADGTTTGNYATEVVCGSYFFRSFLDRYPLVKNYRTSSMSIMRAKKATPEVFSFILSVLDCVCQLPTHYSHCMQICKAHFDGFNRFLDRLVDQGHLTQDQVFCAVLLSELGMNFQAQGPLC